MFKKLTLSLLLVVILLGSLVGIAYAKQEKVPVCHKDGTSAEHTLWVAEPAVKAHLAHGDYLGECNTPTPTDQPVITPTPTDQPVITPIPTDQPTVIVQSETGQTCSSVTCECVRLVLSWLERVIVPRIDKFLDAYNHRTEMWAPVTP